MSEKDSINLTEKIHQLKALIKYLLKKWLLILSFSTISAFIGLYIALKNKPQYHSSLSFVIEGDTGGKGFAGITSAILGGQASANPSIFNSANIMSLLTSRSLIQATLLKPINKSSSKSFADYYIEVNELEDYSKKDKHSKPTNFNPPTASENLTRTSSQPVYPSPTSITVLPKIGVSNIATVSTPVG